MPRHSLSNSERKSKMKEVNELLVKAITLRLEFLEKENKK